MKLRYSTTSPFVRKVHVLAIETGQIDKIELVKTNTADPNSGLNRNNPLNKVPALELDDGSSLYDSRVICEYLDAQAKGSFFPPVGPARWTATATRTPPPGTARRSDHRPPWPPFCPALLRHQCA